MTFLKMISVQVITVAVMIVAQIFEEQLGKLFILFFWGGLTLFVWIHFRMTLFLKNIFKKIEKLKSFRSSIQKITDISFFPGQDRWEEVEEGLEWACKNLEYFANEVDIGNVKTGVVIESISDSLLAVGTNEEILFANNQFRKAFLAKGIKKKNLTKYKLWEITRNVDIRNLVLEAISNKVPLKQKNLLLPTEHHKQGQYFDVRINPLVDGKGNIFGAVSTFHDVTDRMVNEKMQEDFIANIGHEIRTPLTAIKGHTQLLMGLSVEQLADYRSFLERIEKNTDRLTHIINEISTLSTLNSGQELEKQALPVKEFTNDAIADLNRVYDYKKIVVKTDYRIETVWMSSTLLEHVLVNLLDNAFKYTPKDGTITVTWKTSSDNQILLKIKDTGIGIPRKHIGRIFERFYRVDSSRSNTVPGTGLGLAIVQRIVQSYSGNIAVKSEPGQGTVFSVRFPVDRSNQFVKSKMISER